MDLRSPAFKSSAKSIAWALGLLLAGSPALAQTPRALPSPIPIPSAASPRSFMTPEEARTLYTQYVRAQKTEAKALDHQQKLEMKELKSSQRARQKEWEAQEREKRHAFFKTHTKGPERREYIKDFIERRKAFVNMLADERTQRQNEQDVRKKALRDDQMARFKEFQQSLEKGERPPARLWPSGH